MLEERRISLDKAKFKKTLKYLSTKKKILFLTTSNRWQEEKELPKSTFLAYNLAKQLPKSKVNIIEVPKLKIYPCEGNVSSINGNTCGLKESKLKCGTKNPTGYHRCWATINHKDDQLWKISKELFRSDCVLFFSSVRWGQLNSVYQKLIERLTWIENRHSTLNEKNIVKDIDAGLIILGQNWNGKNVLTTQKKVLSFYGFNVINDLCWNWQYTQNLDLESKKSYLNGVKLFYKTFTKTFIKTFKDNK